MPIVRMLQRACSALSFLVATLTLGAALAVPAAQAAVMSSRGPLLWTAPGGVSVQPLDSIACPSAGLCVAVDRGGNVVWSTDPAAGPRIWQVANVDGANELTSISCPSTGLCVAVDGAGNVVTSTNPAGGATAWTVAKIDSSQTQNNTDNAGSVLDRGVSCPSTGLCVAVDAAGNAVVSTNPTGGTAAWTTVHIDTNSTLGCTQGGLACQTPIVGVSCPSALLCTAVDFSGNVLTTGSPTAAAPWSSTSATGGRLGSLWSISCPMIGFCATVDGAGGHAITFNPAAPTAQHARPLPYSLYGVWCQSASLCLASVETHGGISGLLGSFNPTAPASTWSLSSLGGIDGVACPSPAICIAGDDEGNIAAGVTTRALAILFGSELLPSRHLPTIATLDRTHRVKYVFTSPIAGRATLNWTISSTGRLPVVLASATHHFNAPGAATLTLRLTSVGVRVFRTATSRLTVSATATFAASTGSFIETKKRTFTHPPKRRP